MSIHSHKISYIMIYLLVRFSSSFGVQEAVVRVVEKVPGLVLWAPAALVRAYRVPRRRVKGKRTREYKQATRKDSIVNACLVSAAQPMVSLHPDSLQSL